MADQDFRERVLEILSRIETQARENNARLEKRLDSLDTRCRILERDVGWIKGKLEGKREGSGVGVNRFDCVYCRWCSDHRLIALFT